MPLLQEIDIDCPYCGEIITVLIDESCGNQQYVEDCQVCCSPIQLHISLNDSGVPQVQAEQENL